MGIVVDTNVLIKWKRQYLLRNWQAFKAIFQFTSDSEMTGKSDIMIAATAVTYGLPVLAADRDLTVYLWLMFSGMRIRHWHSPVQIVPFVAS